jgi:hypothetical protein
MAGYEITVLGLSVCFPKLIVRKIQGLKIGSVLVALPVHAPFS